MKKILFSISSFIILFLFVPNVFAYNSFTQNVNLITLNSEELNKEIYRGNDVALNNYIIGNYSNNDFYTYYNKVKQSVATAKGYNDFNSFTQDYYYLAHFQLVVSSSTGSVYTNPNLNINFYVIRKDSSNLSNFKLLYGVSSLSGGTLNTSNSFRNYLQMERNTYESRYGFQESINNLGTSTGSITSAGGYQYFFDCVSNPGNEINTCNFNISNNQLNLNIYRKLNGGLLYYYDSNYNFKFYFGVLPVAYNITSYYWFENLKINNSSVFSLGDIIAEPEIIISPNIQDFGSNSFGFNSNYTLIKPNYNSSNSVICPNNRDYDNGICYLYNTDIENYDNTDTSLHHFVRFYLGDNTNIPLRNNYYYIFTFRIYSQYNIPISQLRVHSGSSNNPTNIEKVKITDFTIYKDYQVIFTPNISGDLAVNYIDIYFNDFSTLTDVLHVDYSFGVYKSFKYSEFATIPSDTQITDDYNSNNINNISSGQSSNFFSNFKINDRGLSQVILLPLNFVRSWSNSTCSPVNLPIPHSNLNAQLPCLSSIFSQFVPGFWQLYKIIINGFIIYRVCLSLFRIVKNIYNIENNEIEVIDL